MTGTGFFAGALTAAALMAGAAMPAAASTINWIDWSSASPVAGNAFGSAGSASGSVGGVGFSYSGELESLQSNYPSYGPNGTFNGGTVSNAPPQSSGILQLFGGGYGMTDTITFSTPVTNPVLAIWSLGAGGNIASFQFNGSEPFNIEAGGPSNEYSGSSIYTCGTDAVCGQEGNGTIQFSGTYSSITWTNPTYENWYGFTVGIPASAVPEPATLVLLGVGLVGLRAARRRRG